MRLARHASLGRLASLMMLPAAVLFLPLGAGSADCAAPYLRIGEGNQAPVLTRDSSVTIEGRAFVDGCDDQPDQPAWGCSASREEEEVPSTDVALIVRQGTRHWDLGSEGAGLAADNELGQITWK